MSKLAWLASLVLGCAHTQQPPVLPTAGRAATTSASAALSPSKSNEGLVRTTPPATQGDGEAVLVVNRIVPLHVDHCSSIDRDAAYQLPAGTRVFVVERGVDYCHRVRVTIPSKGEVTGLVAAARLSHLDGHGEPDEAAWAAVNPTLASTPEIAAARDQQAKRAADEDDLRRWAHERMTAFCPDPKINDGSMVVSTGDDKMRAAIAFATCTDPKLRERASEYLNEIADQCFQTQEWKRNCPRKASVEDERTRLSSPSPMHQ